MRDTRLADAAAVSPPEAVRVASAGCMQNAGLDGGLSDAVLLLPPPIIMVTADSFGRSAGFSCTHSRATWMHPSSWSLWISWPPASLDSEGSTRFRIVPLFQCCHIRSRRLKDCSWSLKEPMLLLPVMISRIRTPKLNTSD